MGRYLSEALTASGRDVLVLGRKPKVQFTDKGIHYQAVDASDMAVLPPCWQRWSMHERCGLQHWQRRGA